MFEKMAEIPGVEPPKVAEPPKAEEKKEPPAPWLGGRTVPLPDGLTLEGLQKLSSAEIDAKIREQGAGIGYAAIIALAAGKGGTPSSTQLAAAKFLLDRAAAIEAADNADNDILARMRRLPRAQLVQFIDALERDALAKAIETKPMPVEVFASPVDDDTTGIHGNA